MILTNPRTGARGSQKVNAIRQLEAEKADLATRLTRPDYPMKARIRNMITNIDRTIDNLKTEIVGS